MRIKMRSLDDMGANVPAFLAKLWKIVEDPETNDLIRWSADGDRFIIQNTAQFSRELLPLYYKHNNMASFIRQLNMYGFHKVVSLEAGGLKVDKDEMEFAHPCFVSGHPYLLDNIKRKQIANKLEGDLRPGARSDVYGKVLSEVKNMKGRQESLNSQLVAMKRENEVLWREVALLREKHKQQQTIVNKLVHFFVNLFQADEAGNLRLKRQARLMIKDKTHSAAKVAKLDPSVIHSYFGGQRKGFDGSFRKTSFSTASDEIEDDDLMLDEEDGSDDGMEDRSPEGPVIHEIDASELLNGYSTTELSEEESGLFQQDLCETAVVGEVQSTIPPSGSLSQRHKDNSSHRDMLLDVCPDIVISSAPLDIDAVIAEATDGEIPTTPKALTSGGRGREIKRKRRRRSTSIRPMPTCLTTQQDDGLTIILPALEEVADDPEPMETIVPELVKPEVEQQLGSLEAATSAAIQAISDVAATTTTTASSEERTRTPAIPTTTAIATTTSSNTLDREQLGDHVGSVQSELDNLRELLKGEGYSLDDSTLLGVCPAHQGLAADVFTKIFNDDPMSYELSEMPSGTELTDDKDKENQDYSSDPMITGSLPELTDFLDWSQQVSDAPNDYELMLGDLSTPQMVPGSPGVSK